MKIIDETINLMEKENGDIVSMIFESSKDKRWYPFKDQRDLEMTIMDSIPEKIRNESPFIMLLRPNKNPESLLSFAPLLKWENGTSETNKIESRDSIESGEIRLLINRLLEKGLEHGRNGKITFEGDSINEFREHLLQNMDYKALNIQQSNSSFILGGRFICKFVRKVHAGENPDVEIPQKLYAETAFRNTPKPIGQLVYREKQVYSLMSIHTFIENNGDYWDYFTRMAESLFLQSEHEETRENIFKSLTGSIEEIAKAVGEMHIGLSTLKGKDFASEPVNDSYISKLKSGFLQLCQNLSSTKTHIKIKGEIINTNELGRSLESLIHKINFRFFQGTRITRVHGDLHLGQILRTDNGPVIIDFEGEPMRTPRERTMKQSPLKDVSGIVRSIDYALNFNVERDDYNLVMGQNYSLKLKTKFLEEYWKITSGIGILPDTFQAFLGISEFFELDKAIYELNYEISNRPEWADIPAAAILKIMQRLD